MAFGFQFTTPNRGNLHEAVSGRISALRTCMTKVSPSSEPHYRVFRPVSKPALVFVTPDGFSKDSHMAVEMARRALEGGTSLIQIRDRQASILEIQKIASTLLEAGIPEERLSVNGLDPKHVQAVSKCLGLHIREADISRVLQQVVDVMAQDTIISCSVHSVRSALVACSICQPSYIQVGTMFSTGSHPGKHPEGPQLLRSIRERVGPQQMLIGIGGITQYSVNTVVQHGADGVAVISSISGSENPSAAASTLLAMCRDAYDKIHGGHNIPPHTNSIS